MNAPRTEGQRLLLAVPGSLAEIAAAAGASKAIVSYWRTGKKLPSDDARVRLQDAFGIDRRAWEKRPVASSDSPAATQRPERPKAPPASSTRDAEPPRETLAEVGTLAEVVAHLRWLRERRREAETTSEQIKLADAETRALALKAKLEEAGKSIADRYWRSADGRQLLALIIETLEPFPAARSAMLGALEGHVTATAGAA